MRRLLCLWLLVAVLPAQAVVEIYDFENDQLRQRYQRFVQELRCPKCQNQNLADSNAPIAADLRRELHRLLQAGRSDAEIRDFMVDRYGDYVLYRPRIERRTWLLWGTPLLLLGIGVLVLWRIQARRPRAMDIPSTRPELSELTQQEQQRLHRLLDEEPRS